MKFVMYLFYCYDCVAPVLIVTALYVHFSLASSFAIEHSTQNLFFKRWQKNWFQMAAFVVYFYDSAILFAAEKFKQNYQKVMTNYDTQT